jgi:hypothetical protein
MKRVALDDRQRLFLSRRYTSKPPGHQYFSDLDENLPRIELKIRFNRIIFTNRYMALFAPKIAR